MTAPLVVLAVIAGGASATYLHERPMALTSRLAAGTALGFVLLGLIGFVAASLLGFTVSVLLGCAAVVASPTLLLARRTVREQVAADIAASIDRARAAVSGRDRQALLGFVLFVLLCVPLSIVFARAVYERPDGVYTGIFVNRNDMPLHVDIIEGFLSGANFPPQHPEFAGARLTYPFIVDFVAAQLVVGGLTLSHAIALENVLLALALIVLLHRWARALTHDRTAALITPLLILFGSGLGWLLVAGDLHGNVLSSLRHLPQDYTINTRHLRWGNLTTTILVSQRSFLLGLPIALIVWTLWWQAVGDGRSSAAGDRGRQLRLLSAAGVLTGCMPLVHTHTFMLLMVIGGCLSLLFRSWRAWFAFFAIASVLALPQLWWVSQGSPVHGSSFIAWAPGWTKDTESYGWFWLKNTGLFLPLLVAAIAGWRRWLNLSRALLLLYLPFVACFIVPQMFRLAPRPSANIKVLIFWYIASAPLVAMVIAKLWRGGMMRSVGALAIVFTLTAATGLDVWRVVTGASAVRVFDADAVAFARELERSTPPDAVVLHAPSRNHAVFLSGRYSLLGNLLHVSSHGFDYSERLADIRSVYAGADETAAILARYDVHFIVVGPEERAAFHVSDAAAARFTAVADAGGYRLYRVDDWEFAKWGRCPDVTPTSEARRSGLCHDIDVAAQRAASRYREP